MKYLQNLHTHTTYCDGKNTAEEMVQKAIELGFRSLGFSGHAPMPDSIPASYPDYRLRSCDCLCLSGDLSV